MGVPYEVTNNKALPFRATAEKYYEEEKKITLNQPLVLLHRAHRDHVRSLPPIHNLLAQSEPHRVKSTSRAFLEVFKDKCWGDMIMLVLFWHLSVASVKIGVKKPRN